MANILITGFTPFAGRTINASWQAACWLAEHHNTVHTIRAALLPVIWGAPEQILKELVNSYEPELIISLGEGHPERFAIETRARNQRSPREDNAGRLPAHELIDASGPAMRMASIDYQRLQEILSDLGYPIQLSDDAGAFLCEEALYCLESARETVASVQPMVLFCHLPPFGSEFSMTDAQSTQTCNQASLARFAKDLLSALQTVYKF